jgi:Domain of unknown function (DUF5060)/Protein of unknown function (DUF4038)
MADLSVISASLHGTQSATAFYRQGKQRTSILTYGVYVAATLAGILLWQFPHFRFLTDDPIDVSVNSAKVPRYGVTELNIRHSDSDIANVWDGPSISAIFTSPGGQKFVVSGFHHSKNLWKVRFSPPEAGPWNWTLEWRDGVDVHSANGTFDTSEGVGPGPVRRHPKNPFRLVFADGSLYPAIGIQDCINNSAGGPTLRWGFDGDLRSGAGHDQGSLTDTDTYLSAYSRAGLNLFRWSIDNCSFRLWDRLDSSGNVYLEAEGKLGDDLVMKLREYGFRVYMVLFNRPPFPMDASAPAKMDAVKRYVKYVVARYGAYVDFWELMNESDAEDEWYSIVATYLRSIDPHSHLISTSNPRPDLSVIDINSPHWYQTEDEFSSDRVTVERIQKAKASGQKPVIFGEQGNSGQNWDEGSALRLRIHSWTALFNEAFFIFWNSSFAKGYQAEAANIYLGPQERRYIANLQTFAKSIDSDVQVASISVRPPTAVKAYALSSSEVFAAYLHNHRDHKNPTRGTTVQIRIPHEGVAYWYSPETGTALPGFPVSAGFRTLQVPPFVTDIALIVNGRFDGASFTRSLDPQDKIMNTR